MKRAIRKDKKKGPVYGELPYARPFFNRKGDAGKMKKTDKIGQNAKKTNQALYKMYIERMKKNK